MAVLKAMESDLVMNDDLRRTAGRSWMRVAEDRDGEKLERPIHVIDLFTIYNV
jgi:hypothetical protein